MLFCCCLSLSYSNSLCLSVVRSQRPNSGGSKSNSWLQRAKRHRPINCGTGQEDWAGTLQYNNVLMCVCVCKCSHIHCVLSSYCGENVCVSMHVARGAPSGAWEAVAGKRSPRGPGDPALKAAQRAGGQLPIWQTFTGKEGRQEDPQTDKASDNTDTNTCFHTKEDTLLCPFPITPVSLCLLPLYKHTDTLLTEHVLHVRSPAEPAWRSSLSITNVSYSNLLSIFLSPGLFYLSHKL